MINKHSSKVEVLAAIIEKGALSALESAPKALHNDEAVLLAAATGNGYALSYASNNIRSTNEPIALAALNSSGVGAFQFLNNPVALPALEKYLKNEIEAWRKMGSTWIEKQINSLKMGVGSNTVEVKDVIKVLSDVFKNEKDFMLIVNKVFGSMEPTGEYRASLRELRKGDKEDKEQLDEDQNTPSS